MNIIWLAWVSVAAAEPPAAGGNGPLTIVANFVHTHTALTTARYFSLVPPLFLPSDGRRVALLVSSDLHLGVAYISK